MKVLITGSKGFVGQNLTYRLKSEINVQVTGYDLDDSHAKLQEGLAAADVIFHLAGVNRPQKSEEYTEGNTAFTQSMCDSLILLKRKPFIIFSSSIQAEIENPYGISKRKAEEVLLTYGRETGARVAIFRMKNVFGKWCRPNYNSAVATFCHNIARDLPITISDPANEVKLVYIDDVCEAMMEAANFMKGRNRHLIADTGSPYYDIMPSFKITLGELVAKIKSFKESRSSLQVPALDDPFVYRLYATYLSYLDGSNLAYDLDIKTDNRGSLAEFLKSSSFGQIFISRTKPGITRGNHFHHTKCEKFLVVQGEAVIRFRDIQAGADVLEYRISGHEFRVVDIPPGYTHSIENVGDGELVTLFWADQVFDPDQLDTYYEEVVKG